MQKKEKMPRSYVLFGSNQGDKTVLLERACELINNRCGEVTRRSSLYDSEPWGFDSEEWFLNALLEVETWRDPDTLMEDLLDIEKELGRERHPEVEGYTSRTADLDILYYGDEVICTDRVTVPHPRLHERRFALMPLCELVPGFIHPVFGLSQEALLKKCTDTSLVVKRYSLSLPSSCDTTTSP